MVDNGGNSANDPVAFQGEKKTGLCLLKDWIYLRIKTVQFFFDDRGYPIRGIPIQFKGILYEGF
jgi:hypothetical protein